MSSKGVKAHAQERFGQYAQGYVTSQSHSSGEDLDRLVELAQPQPDWVVLDVATGGGHTALKFAPHVARVVASDLTPAMLQAAHTFIAEQSAVNVVFSGGDAENLPFISGAFNLVTCRIAPHHFPDCFRFVQECARVLKQGGRLVIEDQLVPENERAARYLDAFERLRDPSHHRIYSEAEWRGMFLDAGLSVEGSESLVKSGVKLAPWAERQGCTPQTLQRLQAMLAQAPSPVAVWMRPQCVGTADTAFDHHYILIVGRKER